MGILSKLWPLLTKALLTLPEAKGAIDAQTRDTLAKLGALIGKEVPTAAATGFGSAPGIGGKTAQIEQYELQQQQHLLEMMKKENEFLRIERNKDKRDLEILRRQVEMADVKQEIIFKAMI